MVKFLVHDLSSGIGTGGVQRWNAIDLEEWRELSMDVWKFLLSALCQDETSDISIRQNSNSFHLRHQSLSPLASCENGKILTDTHYRFPIHGLLPRHQAINTVTSKRSQVIQLL